MMKVLPAVSQDLKISPCALNINDTGSYKRV